MIRSEKCARTMKRLDDNETVFLISYVQNRECLWNESNADFRKVSITKKLWDEVGNQLNISGDEAKCKWRNLRGKFRKLVRQSYPDDESNPDLEPQWRFYNAMLFLRDIKHPDQTVDVYNAIQADSGSGEHNGIDEDFEQYDFDFFLTKTPGRESSMSSARKRNRWSLVREAKIKPVNNNSLTVMQSTNDSSDIQLIGDNKCEVSTASKLMEEKKNDDDYYFLMSLLPYIQALNSTEKLELRSSMQNLVTDSYRKHDYNKRLRMNH